MSADDIFNVAVAVARKVVDERSEGKRIYGAVCTLFGWRQFDWEDRSAQFKDNCNQAASEFAAPYLQRIAALESKLASESFVLALTNARIAKLEAENKALRDAAKGLLDIDDALPTSPTDGRFVGAYLAGNDHRATFRKVFRGAT